MTGCRGRRGVDLQRVHAAPHGHDPLRQAAASPTAADLLTDPSEATGVYYDEDGAPMRGSTQVQDPAFCDRYIAESRELLALVHQ